MHSAVIRTHRLQLNLCLGAEDRAVGCLHDEPLVHRLERLWLQAENTPKSHLHSVLYTPTWVSKSSVVPTYSLVRQRRTANTGINSVVALKRRKYTATSAPAACSVQLQCSSTILLWCVLLHASRLPGV